MKKRILITGGQGFIGHHLATTLTAHGYDVTTVDVKKSDPKNNDEWVHFTKDVRVLMQEYDSANKLANIYGEPLPFDLILHLAATPRVGVSLEHPEIVLRNNIDSLIDVLGYCRNHPATSLIFVSSSSVTWSDVYVNPYAMSKHIGEELVKTYANTFGVNATSVRLFNVYGPGEAEYGASTTLIRQCKKALWRQAPIEIHGDGHQIRDFTHVDDVCAGMVSVVSDIFDNRSPLPSLYEIGMGDGSVSVKEIVETFLEGEDLTAHHVPSRPNDPPKTKADPSLWPSNWTPRLSVLDYIRQWKKEGCPLD